MKATVHFPHVTVEFEAESQKALYKEFASAWEVFGERKCGKCDCEDIRPLWRTVKQKKKEFEYPEWQCTNCGAKLSLSSHLEGGTLYPVRKLTPEGLPATGDEAEKGLFDKKGGGWYKWSPPREDGQPSSEVSKPEKAVSY